MRLLIELDNNRFDVEVDHVQAESTLADLLAEAGAPVPGADEPLFVDATTHPASTPVSEVTLMEGSRIARTPAAQTAPLRGWSITVAGGLEAGLVVTVPTSRPMLVGRAPEADITLSTESASWEHLRIQLEGDGVRITDSGSTNGTQVNGEKLEDDGALVTESGTITAGGAVLLLRPALREPAAPVPGSLHNLTPAATAPFNRPPRPGMPKPGEAIQPPGKKDIAPANKFSYISVLAPLVMAAVMVIVLRDLRFALFALLSPVMAIGMWYEQKRRAARNTKEESERFKKALGELSEDIHKAAVAEASRRHEMVPDPATVLRRPALPTTTLWQRRANSPDFLVLHARTGNVPWEPDIDGSGRTRLDDDVKEVIGGTRLTAAPVLVDLSDAGVVGIVGERSGALAVARSLIAQATVHVGSAYLTVGVFCDPGRHSSWEWASWLPHTRQAGSSTGERWMSSHRDSSNAMLRMLNDATDELPTAALLVVLDSEVLTEGRDAAARKLLGKGRSRPGVHITPETRQNRVSGIVIAASEDQLPASCTSIIRVGADANGTVSEPQERTRVEDVILAGISFEAAERCAMDVAHFDDPELKVPGASLPSLVRLPEMLGFDRPVTQDILKFWQNPDGTSTPIGTGESGPLYLDLVKDGPHGLVGGTTGSGKSEFLRSLVGGLAARNDPTRLNFILVDFKGGAAFKACERLPHTIGTISNLDEQLADRAIRALEAEMERRQRVFAEAGEGIDNLPAYLATNPAEPMPRLLLVIDEFAMLAKDFPEVLSALVSVGAVGRTLGVHMILATQRPAGVVNDDILANTNLRVALRVQSREDSSNVIGVAAASSIGRAQTGRAYVKLGQDDITPVQTALVTGLAQDQGRAPVEVREITRFGVPAQRPKVLPRPGNTANDLDLLIDAIIDANHSAGYQPPRPVWPEALGERIDLAGFEATTALTGEQDAEVRSGVVIPGVGGVDGNTVLTALVDEPDLQRQSPAGWDMDEGNLMLLGVAGSGTSTTLSSIALTLARQYSPEDLDLFILDMGSGDLKPLERLPHTSAYVGTGAGGKEFQARFLRHLGTELEDRRANPSGRRRAVFLIDGLASLRDEFQDYEGQELMKVLFRAYADGPALGMNFVVSTTRAKAIPPAMDEVTVQKWLYRLADTYDYSTLGVRGKAIPAPVPGRCVDPRRKLQMHVATPAIGLLNAVEWVRHQWQDVTAKGTAIGRLPDDVTLAQLGVEPLLDGEPWLLPIGMQETTLKPCYLEVYEGEHIIIGGPARSGKSTLLLAMAQSLRGRSTVQGPVQVWAICDRRSPLVDAELDRVAVGADEIPALIASLRLESGPVFLLVDDAERVDDADKSLENLIVSGKAGLCVVSAGRTTDLRMLYTHWTKPVRKSRLGVLLQPSVDHDGELLGVNIPRRAPVEISPGRGYAAMAGQLELVQTISPTGG